MKDRSFNEIMSQVARSIKAAAVLYGATDERQVDLVINIERWNSLVAHGNLGLLLHQHDTQVVIHHDNTRTLQLVYLFLIIAHNH